MSETDLTGLLQAKTQAARGRILSAAFIRAVLEGALDEALYRAYLQSMYFVYQTLEGELRRHAPGGLPREILRPEMFRAPAILADLHCLYDNQGVILAGPGSRAQRYMEHLGRVCRRQPIALAAHVYVWYLDDLFGERLLRDLISQTLGLKDGKGTAFFQFPEIPDLKDFKTQCKADMDALPLDQEEKIMLGEETERVYSFYRGILDDLRA